MEGERVNLTEISEAIDSPSAFTAKILQKLVKANIVDSVKGPHGGFIISQESMLTVNLEKVVNVIDGDGIYSSCGLGLSRCNEKKPCPLHFQFKEVRDDLRSLLQRTSLKDLTGSLDNGLSVLKN